MARMYPEDIAEYDTTTAWEKAAFHFFKEAARPHRDFICIYEPPIGGLEKEPDFVLVGKKLGLIVFVVKDWTSQQIRSYTPFQFTLLVSGKREKKENPDKQAKGYVDALMEKLREIPGLLSHLPPHEGELKIPIGRMVVFPNIKWEEYHNRGLHWIIPQEKALLEDDIGEAGEILRDPSGSKFFERVKGSLPFRFQGLAQREIEKILFSLWPESKIELPQRQGVGKLRFEKEVKALDDAQSRLALRLKPGHQIIKGPPGSGKTLVLVHRCCHVYKYHPQIKKILFVCYNIALVSYLKRLLREKCLGMREVPVRVSHFYALCSEILGTPVHYENEEADYYEHVAEEALSRVEKGESKIGPFDAIFIEEGQDFGTEMLRTLFALLRPGGELVISIDPYQDLYKRTASWKSLGINASGRTMHLKKVYRNTIEIFDFTQRFIGQTPEQGKQLALLPHYFAFHGGLPELRRFRSIEEVEEFLVEDLNGCIEGGEYKRSEIAIIYDDKVYGPKRFAYDNRALPMRILKELELSGLPATWVSQDVRSKEMFDVTADRISLISIHSSKGLDFDLVYLVGADHIHPTRKDWKNLTTLLYVAMTRAKYRLVIPYVEETELIRRMRHCLADR